MLEQFKQLTIDQYHAALRTLDLCVERCPEAGWKQPIHELAFCQAAFHALFFADLYLGKDIEEQKEQPFHVQNQDVFRDYEELEPRRQVLLYERDWITLYIGHCREKAVHVMQSETEESLQTQVLFPWYKITRAEMHVNNIRHIQHHGAQLILRLRLDHSVEMPWVSSGWKQVD